MSISIYITGASFQIVEGNFSAKKSSVENVLTLEFPPQVMDNGAVLDEKEFVRTLRDFWLEHDLPTKDVGLLIYNKIVTTSLVKVPFANEKTTYEFVKREMTSYDEDIEYLYAYQLVKKADKNAQKAAKDAAKKEKKAKQKKKKISKEEQAFLDSFADEQEVQTAENQAIPDSLNSLLAARIDYLELKRYITLMTFAGIGINSVQSGIVNLMTMIEAIPEVTGSTCIVQIHDGGYIVNLLYLNGVYQYSSASRIFEPEGTIGFAIEVARSVSGILQFMKANDMEYDSMKVFLLGLNPEDTINCTDSILQMNSSLLVEPIDISWLADNRSGKEIESYIVGLSGLLAMKKTADFYPNYMIQSKKEGKGGSALRTALPVFGIGGVLLAATLVLGVMNITAGMQLSGVEKYNDSVMDMAMQYDITLDDATYYEQQYNAVQSLKDNINSYPHADSNIEQVITTTAAGYVEIEVNSYDAATGLYNVSTTASDVKKIHQYIDKLRKQKEFVDIDYSGYTFDDSTGKWTVNVLCYLSESAGKDGR